MYNEMSLDKSKDYIYSLDLSGVIDRLVYSEGWMESDAVETCKLYRNFLFLIKKYGSLSPSLDVDEFWHNHIICTEHYTESCIKIYGKYLHHFIHHKKDHQGQYHFNKTQLSPFAQTQELHYKEFGSYIYATKSNYPKILYSIMKKIGVK